MIVTISTRQSIEDWKTDIDQGFNAIGIYKIAETRKQLFHLINNLVDLLNEYDGIIAHRLDRNQCHDGFEIGLKVSHREAGFPFEAYINYYVNEDRLLVAEVKLTHRASSADGAYLNPIEWRLDKYTANDGNSPKRLLSLLKNAMIQYIANQLVGDRLMFVVVTG
jgi:hypothetical protein